VLGRANQEGIEVYQRYIQYRPTICISNTHRFRVVLSASFNWSLCYSLVWDIPLKIELDTDCFLPRECFTHCHIFPQLCCSSPSEHGRNETQAILCPDVLLTLSHFHSLLEVTLIVSLASVVLLEIDSVASNFFCEIQRTEKVYFPGI
jgi:hypothetical protein